MAYTAFDRFLAWRRFCAARPHIRLGASVCDIGCGFNPWFLRWVGPGIRRGVGLDYQIGRQAGDPHVIHADITKGLPVQSAQFDHAVMLAVLEHLSEPMPVLQEAHRIIVPDGSLIMTWPTEAVDPILGILRKVGIVSKEMESDKHQQRIPVSKLQSMLRDIGFDRISHCTFELGLNNLIVAFKKA